MTPLSLSFALPLDQLEHRIFDVAWISDVPVTYKFAVGPPTLPDGRRHRRTLADSSVHRDQTELLLEQLW
jgi:hypothetical protein